MPPKQTQAKISQLKPTDSEVLAAKEELDKLNPKQKKAKFQSMTNYEKLHPDDELKQSRGGLRQQYLTHYLVHQLRDKAARSTITTSYTLDESSEKETKDFEWSAEQMDKKLGDSTLMKQRKNCVGHISLNQLGKF